MTEKTQVSGDVIGAFLEGSNPQKYIVAIEAPYHQNSVSLIINDPEKGKYIETDRYKPFLWMKHDVSSIIYGGDRAKISKAAREHNVKFYDLAISDANGVTPQRLMNGYKYLARTTDSYTNLLTFFKNGGVDVYGEEHRSYFMTISPTEQYLIQTGKRLFKGFEDYDELHRFQFDLETTGLIPSVNSIFQIGMKDNRGYERVIEVTGETEREKRESEKEAIKEFFQVIDDLKPDLIAGYNSENFDWDFFYGRCERLSIDITNIAITLNGSKIRRSPSMLKLGGNVEHYQQTNMWGVNIIDIMHSVRRAQAINSDIKKAGLKYITKFSKIAKKNRVYVDGDKIHNTWSDFINDYYFNEENGDFFKFNPENEKHVGIVNDVNNNMSPYVKVTGAYIVQRYLLDDLWETEQIDARFNQATFLLGKLIPTSYMRSSTMGTAGIWKLIMLAWSYENQLGIPELQKQETFTGGLSRLLEVGYAKNVAKLDYAALYPNIELTWEIFPDIDITGVMKGMLLYIAETRDIYKKLKGQHEDLVDELKKELELKKDILTPAEISAIKEKIKLNEGLADKYDKKQLPVKILANSFFGSFGAPHLFPWGDLLCAEETTCRGRQYLRLMVRHFKESYGFRPLVGDTDGFNFAIPDDVENIKYTATGSHRLTEKYKGMELTGLKAVVADFNEKYMIGRMGLDIDGIANSTINFARKNYANDMNGKVKLVGNTIKSKKMPVYIEEFLDEGIRLLLDGKGYDFIEAYYRTVDKISNYEIPLMKIASKSSVRTSVANYKLNATKKNKAGNPMPKQAHMELILQHNLNPSLGDVIYYVNTGTSKSQGDIKSVKNKETGKVEVELMCKLIPNEQLENNPDLTTDEYNAPKYLSAFNKRIHPLLVCFSPEIRDNILIEFKKVKRNKETFTELEDRKYFTEGQAQLTAGFPFEDGDQDDYYKDLMEMEDKEILFWTKVDKVPNNIELEEWEKIKADFLVRMKAEREEGILNEKRVLDGIFRRLEIEELINIEDKRILPISITSFTDVDVVRNEAGEITQANLVSKKWNVPLCNFWDIFIYKEDAIERQIYYNNNPLTEVDYDSWVSYRELNMFNNGTSTGITTSDIIEVENTIVVDEVKEIEVPQTVEDVEEKEPEDEWSAYF